MRILISGSRDWSDRETIGDALMEWNRPENVLVSGACPSGGDALCEEFAEGEGWAIERHPADWKNLGRSAGYIRNAEMVKLGADLALVFIRNGSRGASMVAS
jgi:hypothetical protein